MKEFPLVIVILAVLTLLVLVAGLLVMAKGGKLNQKYSNRLMMLRVALQALTLLLVIVSLALVIH